MPSKIRTTAAMALILAALASPVLAQGNSGRQHDAHRGPGQESLIDVHIDIGARNIIYDYYGTSPGCPPGLAKKGNGCMPPGQARKQYEIGHRLDVDYRRLPRDLLRRLPPPPSGYFYGRVDEDVLLIAEATHRVVDAVVAVEAARNALQR